MNKCDSKCNKKKYIPGIWRHWVQVQAFVRLHHSIPNGCITRPNQYQHPSHANNGRLQAKLRGDHKEFDRLINIRDAFGAEKLTQGRDGSLHLGLKMYVILPIKTIYLKIYPCLYNEHIFTPHRSIGGRWFSWVEKIVLVYLTSFCSTDRFLRAQKRLTDVKQLNNE